MLVFLKHVAESVAEQGIQGLLAEVPGGKFAYGVAEGVLKKYRERKREAQLRADLMDVAQAAGERVAADAVEAARAAFAAAPAGAAGGSNDDIITLQLYLSAVPDAVRASLRRPADPTGRTAPPDFTARSADDVVRLLPPRMPRFRPGADLPGMPGWGLEKLLGTGGFGEVWLARHRRLVYATGAVKFCFAETGRNLIREAGLINRVARAGGHPNLVPLNAVHLDGDTPWLMFEYVPGGSLTEWVHRLAALPAAERVARATAALAQLVDAVAFSHTLSPPVVHRDLKPSNVLYDPAADALRVTDFGIGAVTACEALRQDRLGEMTRGGRLQTYLRGSHTPLYASPQQRDGRDADPRDDVHALGVIGYQMLTGHLTQGAGPDFADDLRETGVSDELVALLGKCAASRPERRPRDAWELARLLARCRTAGAEPPGRHGDPDPEELTPIYSDDQPGEPDLPGDEVVIVPDPPARLPDSVRELKRLAEQGDTIAMCTLGFVYRQGNDVPLDDVEAVRWFRRAAAAGSADGMNALARSYSHGLGVPQSPAEARRWYRRAAATGSRYAADALQRLGEP